MIVPVYDMEGKVVDKIELDESVFGVPLNKAVVHQALVRQLANRRAGTASTKTRGEVIASTRKLYRQKHTGFARAGSRKSPPRRGGGVIFGPHPRSYRQRMPKKMRRLALKCVCSAKVADDEVRIIKTLDFDVPRTKKMKQVLQSLETSRSVLIVTAKAEPNVYKSACNLPKVKTLPADLLNVADLLSYKYLFMTIKAVEKAQQIWGEKNSLGNEK
jgi:large subunit ribosomal protein L4